MYVSGVSWFPAPHVTASITHCIGYDTICDISCVGTGIGTGVCTGSKCIAVHITIHTYIRNKHLLVAKAVEILYIYLHIAQSQL